jgi:hypothetical protein
VYATDFVGAIGATTPAAGTFTTVSASGHVTLEGVTSTGATGTGKLVFDGTPTLVTPNIGAATGTSLSVSGSLTSTVATGTAPLVVSSTTQVTNLNASQLVGATWVAPGTIGSTTPSTGAFTTLTARAGTDTTACFAEVTLNLDDATGTGSPGDTNENTLKTFSVPAATLATNGDALEFFCSFRCAADATTKRIRIYFGATAIFDTTAIANNNVNIVARGIISRTGAATQSAAGDLHIATNGAAPAAPSSQVVFAGLTETLSGAVTLKATVTLGAGAALNDVIQDFFTVKYLRKA